MTSNLTVASRWSALGVSALVCCLSLITSLCRADDACLPIPVDQVSVGGEIGRRIDTTIQRNLLTLDPDRDFLSPLVGRDRKSGYVAIGKLIDAVVAFAAYSQNEDVVGLKDHLIERALAAQQPDGYLGIMAPASRIRSLWDIHEGAYLILGLSSDYEHFGNDRSLEGARRLADYIVEHWSAVPADWGQTTGVATSVAVTGLERAMIRLSRLSEDGKYVEFCLKQRKLAEWSPEIVIGRRPPIDGHIYGYLARSLSQLEIYRTHPDERLLGPTRQAIEFLTKRNGMTITGGCGQWEIWTQDQDGRGELAETCATAYQVRVYDSLLRLTGDAYYGDLLERTIFNTLFAAQSPDGSRIRYYTPFEGERSYFPQENYCCPANYRRVIAELPKMVYYHDQRGLAINLYTESQADLKLSNGVSLRVRQQTDYPSSGTIAIHLAPAEPVEFTLRLRIPAWCTEPVISVNGDLILDLITAGRFHSVKRTWKDGDVVRLELPMPWRLVRGHKRQAGRAAVMRGPLVFCLNPAQNGRLAELDGADLGRITLDPTTFGEPLKDDSVRPNGIACKLQAWKPGYRVARPGDMTLQLTEFADPGGRAVYFRLQELSIAVEDELLSVSP